MTLQETRLDLCRRGMVIAECITTLTPPGMIEIHVTKFDTDGLRVSSDANIHLYQFLDSVGYIEELKNRGASIDNFINNRHYADINSCQHEIVNIGNKACCSKCMGTFGEKIILNIGVN